MKTSINPLPRTALLALAISAAPALAGGPTSTGTLPTPANRIVGTWLIAGDVNGAWCTPASNGPPTSPRSYLMFNAGGTITELPRLPSNATPAARSFGVGDWYYNPRSRTYYVTFRFDWYANGSLQGYTTVDREIQLSADGNSMSGSAVAVRYLENGTEVFSQCGNAIGNRL